MPPPRSGARGRARPVADGTASEEQPVGRRRSWPPPTPRRRSGLQPRTRGMPVRCVECGVHVSAVGTGHLADAKQLIPAVHLPRVEERQGRSAWNVINEPRCNCGPPAPPALYPSPRACHVSRGVLEIGGTQTHSLRLLGEFQDLHVSEWSDAPLYNAFSMHSISGGVMDVFLEAPSLLTRCLISAAPGAAPGREIKGLWLSRLTHSVSCSLPSKLLRKIKHSSDSTPASCLENIHAFHERLRNRA